MRDRLYLGDRSYSSWSLRAWLLYDRFDVPFDTTFVDFDTGPVAEQMTETVPARTVPAVRFADGALVWDSLAIAEELASRHPQAGFWPGDQAWRGAARSLTTEMHSGFGALRSACPMNLRAAYRGFPASREVLADVARIDALWAYARAVSGGARPWLFGEYGIVDAFFAPVAARIAGYDMPVGEYAAAYVAAHLSDPAFRRWRAMGLAKGATLARYAMTHPLRPWPGPEPVPARPMEDGTGSVNDTCPYSGKPVTHFAEIAGHRYGFCNAFCRDKTVADAAAWPAFMAINLS